MPSEYGVPTSAVAPERSKIAPTLMSALVFLVSEPLAASFFLSLPQATPTNITKQSGIASFLAKRFILFLLGVSIGTAIFGNSPWPAATVGRGHGARTAGRRPVRDRTASAGRRAVCG